MCQYSVSGSALLTIDQIGYWQLHLDEANRFFPVMSSCGEKGSVILISSLPLGQWDQSFAADSMLMAALLSRLQRYSHLLQIQGKSYRLCNKRRAGP